MARATGDTMYKLAGRNERQRRIRERAPTVCIYATIAAAASPMDKRYGAVLGRGEGGRRSSVLHTCAHIYTHTLGEKRARWKNVCSVGV